jgi:peptide-methionine (R)-S-oxide reductase
MQNLSFLIVLALVAFSCNRPAASSGAAIPQTQDKQTIPSFGYYLNSKRDTIRFIQKTEVEWKTKLSPQEYYVLREKGTERAFTGDLTDLKKDGLYTCRGCGLPLFHSKHKYNSGSGWPSFFDVFDKTSIATDTDYDLGYARTELMCARCGGHLGHVFDDGPQPTGLRYCINSVSLDFIEEKN